MPMHLESTSREAFELVTGALESIDKYRESRDVTHLATARMQLASATSKDPLYFRAAYYGAMVDDLVGRPKEAVAAFQKLLGEQPRLAEEVRYNLGVAWYHQYSHSKLDQAIKCFEEVLRNSGDPTLQALAHAGLAQAHAMHMIPKHPERPDLPEIESHYRAASDHVKRVFYVMQKTQFGEASFVKEAKAELEWTAYNASGMASMYYSDYFPPDTEAGYLDRRIPLLRDAIAALDHADNVSPKNWANYCDMASARMRLARYEPSERLVREAFHRLKIVIDTLRPGYGFAIYETGRIHRLLTGNFTEAAKCFERVLAIDENDRDVGADRLNLELDRARKSDPTFP